MREDIVGMLKNAIEHGGNPSRVAQSLINSGYPVAEVQQALSYVVSLMPQSQSSVQGNPHSTITPRSINQNQPAVQGTHIQSQIYQSRSQAPNPQAYQFMTKPLPSTKPNPEGTGKLAFMIGVLLILIGSLISVIIFKNKIFDLIG
jgi:hypothetical protein